MHTSSGTELSTCAPRGAKRHVRYRQCGTVVRVDCQRSDALTQRTAIGALPELPQWETTPVDRRAAIAQVKAALRARIEGSGRSVDEVFAVIEARVRAQVDEIAAVRGPKVARCGR